MENKINIAEILKDCPRGMELDCTIFEGTVILESVNIKDDFPIIIRLSNGNLDYFTKIGGFTHDNLAKCVIFPKGKTTWEGFQKPFKDGDIVACDCCGGLTQVFIFKNYQDKENNYAWCYVMYGTNGNIFTGLSTYYITRYATEEEKQKLFDAIKENGYCWNAETKTLNKLPKFKVGDIIRSKNKKDECFHIIYLNEDNYMINVKGFYLEFKDQDNYELIQPKFKVGDRIKTAYNPYQYVIKEVTDTHYTLVEVECKFEYTESIIEDENWKLVSNKFDINTLVPFESRVLVRDKEGNRWRPAIFGCKFEDHDYPFFTMNECHYKQCIPYEGNEHLRGKTDDCDEYYKTWED